MKRTSYIYFLFFIAFYIFTFSLNAQQYTLQDDDVVIENGVIQSCSYNFVIKDIIIPEVLQGQTVVGIADSDDILPGVFRYKGIESIIFPTTIEYIGRQAFDRNNISNLDLGGLSSLKRIGYMSFNDCKITSLSLTGCSSLEQIERQAFYRNELGSLNLNQCTNLVEIESEAFKLNFIDSLHIESCSSLKSLGSSAFSDNLITNLNLSACTSLRSIGFYAFNNNSISDLNISNCGQLTYIGGSAFQNNSISGIVLPACIGYESSGWKDLNRNFFSVGSFVTDLHEMYYVAYTYTLLDEDVVVENNTIVSCSYDFWFKSLLIPETLDGQTITSIRDGEEFNDGVFVRKSITELHLPTTIEYIGDYAFGANILGYTDLSASTKLEYIGERALTAGYELLLPVCSGYESLGWMDENGSTYNGGDVIQYLGDYLYVPYPYTLKDEDVVMENGIIQSCSYRFIHKDIIIPETLQQQTVIGILDAESNSEGVFYMKNLTSIQFPSTIEDIGSWAFGWNNILNLDLSHCNSLKQIGSYAFHYNYLEDLNLNNCSALTDIGNHAFASHSLQQLDLSDCVGLKSIGTWAFAAGYNSDYKLIDVNLQECSSLLSISRSAFGGNDIITIDLSECTSLAFIGRDVFSGNELESFTLPQCEGYEEYGWKNQSGNLYNGGTSVFNLASFYYVPYNYTLQDEDVVIENGIIQECLYNFQFKSIIIPDMLQDQLVKQTADKSGSSNDAFGGKDLVKIHLPYSIEIIGNKTFASNSFLYINFSQCSNLLKIGESAFSATFYIDDLNLNSCTSLQSISDFAFSGNSFESVTISNCHSLMYIGVGAFGENGPDSFQLPVCYGFESYGWKDGDGNNYVGGDEVTGTWELYYVPYPYTLQDYDVVIEDGVIQSCSYNFLLKEIIIPDTLQQQQVVGIASVTDRATGVFASNNIIAVDIPNSIKYIGDFAFFNNYIDSIDLDNKVNLWYIGANSLNENIFDQIELPEPSYPGFDFWEDDNGNAYYAGEVVSDLLSSYVAIGVAGTVTFIVQDADENLVENAEIEFYQQQHNTNVVGSAVFENVFSGDYAYRVSKSGYITNNGEVTISGNDTTINIELIDVGINEQQLSLVVLHPNPATNTLYFKTENNFVRIEIYSMDGNLIEQIDKPITNAIDVGKLSRGLYIVKMISEDKLAISAKFVKK